MGASYDDQLRVAQAAEAAGYDAFFRSDHFLVMGEASGEPGPTDSWVTLGGARPGDLADPAGHAGDLGDVPAARPARDRGGAGGRDVAGPRRARPGLGLVRGRARGVRHPVPRPRRAVRPAHRAAGDHHRAVGDVAGGAVLLHRAHYTVDGFARAAQTGAAAAAAGDRRRPRREAHARTRGPLRRPNSMCRSSGWTRWPRSSRGWTRRAGRSAAPPASWCARSRRRSPSAATTPRWTGGP